MSRIASTILAIDQARASGRPGWLPASPAREIRMLRRRRSLRRQARLLAEAKWAELLADADRTAHFFSSVLRGTDKKSDLRTLMSGVPYIGPSLLMHGDVLAGRGLPVSIGGEDDAPGTPRSPARIALDDIMQRCLWPARWMELCRALVIDGEAYLHAVVAADGVVLEVRECDGEDEIVCAMGPAGHNGQPPAIERRWIVELADPSDSRKTITYLRVERHREIDGVGLIEQEAYRTASTDPLQDLAEASNDDRAALRRVPLAQVLPGTTLPEQSIVPGGGGSAIVHIVRDMASSRPRMLVSDATLSGADDVVAALTKLTIAYSRHALPKTRVPEALVDKATGRANLTDEAIIDPNKQYEYIASAQVQFDQLVGVLRGKIDMALVDLRMCAELIGLQTRETAQPMTAESRRLKGQVVVTTALSSARYVGPAVSRALTRALAIESTLPGRMYAATLVTAQPRPELPEDVLSRAQAQAELLREGLTSRRAAVAAVHGDEAAAQIIAEIEQDQQAASDRQREASFSAIGMPIAGGPGTGEQGPGQAGDGAGTTGDAGGDA